MKNRPCLYAAAVLFLVAAPVAAEMYHWVDENGVNHFSNSPPPAGVKAENSWAEVQYDAAADRARGADNQRIIKAAEVSDAAQAETANAAAAADDDTLMKKTDELQNQRAALAAAILANPYNFRDQAKVLRRQINDVDRQIAEAQAMGTDAATLLEKRRNLWDELFTSRYVVREGYAPMEQYQEVIRQLDALKR